MASLAIASVAILTIPLASGAVIAEGAEVGVIPGTFTCTNASAVTLTKVLGRCGYAVDQTAGDTVCQVILAKPLEVKYFTNAASPNNIVLSSDFLARVNFANSTTVTKAANNGSGVTYARAGLVIDVSTTYGVGIAQFDALAIDLLS